MSSSGELRLLQTDRHINSYNLLRRFSPTSLLSCTGELKIPIRRGLQGRGEGGGGECEQFYPLALCSCSQSSSEEELELELDQSQTKQEGKIAHILSFDQERLLPDMSTAIRSENTTDTDRKYFSVSRSKLIRKN